MDWSPLSSWKVYILYVTFREDNGEHFFDNAREGYLHSFYFRNEMETEAERRLLGKGAVLGRQHCCYDGLKGRIANSAEGRYRVYLCILTAVWI